MVASRAFVQIVPGLRQLRAEKKKEEGGRRRRREEVLCSNKNNNTKKRLTEISLPASSVRKGTIKVCDQSIKSIITKSLISG